MRRMWALAVAVVLVGAACAPPDGGGSGPTWTGTRLARTAGPSGTVNRSGAWTDDGWFATTELTTPTGGASSARLLFYPRTGPAGSVLGTPQRVTVPTAVGLSGPLGEHVVALPTSAGADFFRPTAGVWGPSGSMTLPDGFQLSAMTDHWALARRIPGNPAFTGDGEVQAYALDTSGPVVVATPAATFSPDPSWPAALREGFGQGVALDGDLAAVSASGLSAPTAGGVRVFRADAGTWSAVQSLGGTTEPTAFGRNPVVDDGPTVDRLAFGNISQANQSAAVETYTDNGSGFVAESTLLPDPALTDTSNGLLFGSSLAVDGDLLAVTARSTTVASAEVGHAPVTVGHVQLLRRGVTAWSREGEVGTFTVPYDADVASAYPYRLQASGNHVAVTVLANPDPPVGCTFPCFNIGLEAWSLDRV